MEGVLKACGRSLQMGPAQGKDSRVCLEHRKPGEEGCLVSRRAGQELHPRPR